MDIKKYANQRDEQLAKQSQDKKYANQRDEQLAKQRQEHNAKEDARREKMAMRDSGSNVDLSKLKDIGSNIFGGIKGAIDRARTPSITTPKVQRDVGYGNGVPYGGNPTTLAPRRPSGSPLPGPSGMVVRDPSYTGPAGPVPSDTGRPIGNTSVNPNPVMTPNANGTFGPSMESGYPAMKKGGRVKAKAKAKSSYSSGGKVSSASKRGDGIATKGKTKGRMI